LRPAGATGEKGATGPAGPTGEKGATGPAGSFPEVLPAGKTESGFWATSTGAPATTGRVTTASISFAIPLPAAPEHVVYLAPGEKKEGCEGTGLLPKAPEGTLCVYAETQKLEGTEAFKGIFNAEGAAGASALGAAVEFEPSASEATSLVVAEGAWAVTAK